MTSFAAGIAVKLPPHDAAPLRKVPSELIAEWPVGTFIENLVVRPDGKVLVAIHSTHTLEIVDSGGVPAVFATLPGPVSGLAFVGDDLFVNVSRHGTSPCALFRVDAEGASEPWVEFTDASSVKGATPFVGKTILVSDAVQGRILIVDTAARTQRVWKDDAAFKKTTGEPWLPGVNGLKIFENYVYFSNTDAATIGRIPFGKDGAPGPVEIVAERFTCDDFAFDTAGNLFATTHMHNTVTRLSPSGERKSIAGHHEGVVGSTAAAFGRTVDDVQSLYVTGTGGIVAPFEGRVRPATLVRMYAGAKGYPVANV